MTSCASFLDETDPCGTAAALRKAYAELVMGGKAQTLTFRAGPNGVERSVTYNKADPERLLALVRDWEQKCAAAQAGGSGVTPRRFAYRAGGHLRWPKL